MKKETREKTYTLCNRCGGAGDVNKFPNDPNNDELTACKECDGSGEVAVAHTPTPWMIDGGKGKKGERYVWMKGNYMGGHAIATVHDRMEDSEANAAFIVRAVNSLEVNEARIRDLEARCFNDDRDYRKLRESHEALLKIVKKLVTLLPSNEGLGGHAPIGAFVLLGHEAQKAITQAEGK